MYPIECYPPDSTGKLFALVKVRGPILDKLSQLIFNVPMCKHYEMSRSERGPLLPPIKVCYNGIDCTVRRIVLIGVW